MPVQRPAAKSIPRARSMIAAVLVALAMVGTLTGGASASHLQVSMFQDDAKVLTDPAGTLLHLRQLGANQLRIAVRWLSYAPKPNSFKRPHIDATKPSAYPAAAWAPLDAAVRDAAAQGIAINFNVVGGAPLWATGPGMPRTGSFPYHNWEPNAALYGQFVRALGTRYSGNYTPATKRLSPGNPADLPRVDFWSIWNEPTYGPSLAPQALPGVPGPVEYSPRLYRSLLNAAWGALRATGHGADTILFGEVTPRNNTLATNKFGNFNGMWPLQWLRALYCVDSSYHELRGSAATLRGCPANGAVSARFVSQNPVLFHAGGFADHPYSDWLPPNRDLIPSPNGTGLAEIGNLERALNRLVAVYHQHKVFPIWNTEFGYITSPPKRPNPKDRHPWPSQPTAAYYDNWAEYISWKDPRIMSFDQYELQDPFPALPTNDYGLFASGLINYNGTPKPGYAAWRMPLYLPVTSASRGTSLEVWGDVRPVRFTRLDVPYDNETVQILYRPAGSQKWQVQDIVPIGSPEGYFDVHETFPGSGTVELSWTYPNDPLLGLGGSTVYSRQVQITLR